VSDAGGGGAGPEDTPDENATDGNASDDPPERTTDADPDTPSSGEAGPPGVRERLGVGAAVVLVVLFLSALAGATVVPGPPTQTLSEAPDPNETAEPFRTENVAVERTAADGEVSIDGGDGSKTVLVDEPASADQADTRQLVRAITLAGHDVEFRSATESLESQLNGTDAYVAVAPRTAYTDEDVDAVREFTGEGGRLVLLGEPDRIEVVGGGLSPSLQTAETELRSLSTAYGIVFGNRYLYDTTAHDANYRQVFAEPTDAAPGQLDRAVLSTSTHIEADGGTVVLETPATTRLSDGGGADRYPVVVADGNVLAVGDSTFVAEGNHNVAGNEELIAYIVEFALEGDRG